MNKKEQFAIDFAKYLFSKSVTRATSIYESITYKPKEFNLMLGTLMVQGKELIKDFKESIKNDI